MTKTLPGKIVVKKHSSVFPPFHTKGWCIHFLVQKGEDPDFFRTELHSISKDVQSLKISWAHQLLVKSVFYIWSKITCLSQGSRKQPNLLEWDIPFCLLCGFCILKYCWWNSVLIWGRPHRSATCLSWALVISREKQKGMLPCASMNSKNKALPLHAEIVHPPIAWAVVSISPCLHRGSLGWAWKQIHCPPFNKIAVKDF